MSGVSQPGRYSKRADRNQPDIVAALRKMGCLVFVMGYPFDLLVWHRLRWHVIELKDGGGRLTEAQERDIAAIGYAGAVKVVRSAPEALQAVMNG